MHTHAFYGSHPIQLLWVERRDGDTQLSAIKKAQCPRPAICIYSHVRIWVPTCSNGFCRDTVLVDNDDRRGVTQYGASFLPKDQQLTFLVLEPKPLNTARNKNEAVYVLYHNHGKPKPRDDGFGQNPRGYTAPDPFRCRPERRAQPNLANTLRR